jgi:ABC-type phosphate transport system auxiliary subunit
MANRETLLRLLTEYNVALERLRQEQEQASLEDRLNDYSTRTIAKQLSYLEYRVLQLETQLSIIDIDVNDPSRGRFQVDTGGNILHHLNPWHPNFRIWSYVTAIAIFMFSVVVFNIVSAFSLF